MRYGLRVFLCCLLALLTACGGRVELMAAMPEPDANEVLAALVNAGIAARKTAGKEGMVGLSVDAAEVGRAVDLLRAQGLPRERYVGMGEVFRKEGLISSPLEERARYIHALSQELRGTLAQIDGVLAARVHVVLPERGTSGEAGTPSSAAVFLKHLDSVPLDTVVPQVRRLVLHSIPNLAADKVSIVLVPALTPAPPATPPAAPAATGLVAAVVVLAVLLVLALAALATLAYRFWWPHWQQRRRAPAAEAA